MLFHDKTIIPVLTMWNGTHYRPRAQKLGETRITYWSPYSEKELSLDRVKEDWLNTTFTLWTDYINSTNLYTHQEHLWDFTPPLKCSSGLCSSGMLYAYTSSWVTDVLGPLSMEPTDCLESLVTKHKSMVRKHLRRAVASTETTIFICCSQVFYLDLLKHLCCIWCGKWS